MKASYGVRTSLFKSEHRLQKINKNKNKRDSSKSTAMNDKLSNNYGNRVWSIFNRDGVRVLPNNFFIARLLMTTAARPTFEPAEGGSGRNEKDLSTISRQYSSRDLPGHAELKYRKRGQGSVEETWNWDFRKELEDTERTKKWKPFRIWHQ